MREAVTLDPVAQPYVILGIVFEFGDELKQCFAFLCLKAIPG